MKQVVRFGSGLAIAISACVIAGPVTIPNSFSAGTPARAAEVNANFNAVAAAVNDNNSRLTTIETNAAKPDLAPNGNLVLGNSTPTSGSVIKDAHPFMHDFGYANTFLGSQAGNFTLTGDNLTAVGHRALVGNTTGDSNTAFGSYALTSNSTGFRNVASGSFSLSQNSTGAGNTAHGYGALGANTTAAANTGIGAGALDLNTTGWWNTAVGQGAMTSMTFGEHNTALGNGALSALQTGQGNTAIGSTAGSQLMSGTGNIYVGNIGAAQESVTIRIGNSQTRAFIAGIRGVTTTSTNAVPVVIDSNGQLGTINSSRRFKEDITDMGDASSSLMRLRPVTFYYRNDQNPGGRALQYGLVAEEVAAVAPGLVAHSRDGEIETVFYEFLPPMLLNEFQKQQRTIEAQDKRLAQLERELAALRKRSAN